jgi:hypothetical protein
MKQILSWIALVCGLSLQLHAQKAPGYMGKVFFLHADIAYAPALSGPTANNRGANTYGDQGYRLGFITKYGLQLGYTLTRSQAVSLEWNYMASL